MRRLLLCLAFPALLLPALWADDPPAAPNANTPYTLQARYKIEAGRAQRHRLFHEMVKRLAAVGVQKDKGLEGEELYGTELTGTVPGSALPALLNDPHVQAAILTPKGFQPGEGDVLARFYLTTALGLGRQRETADKARELLKPLGFKENVGSDTQESRRLLGRIPYAQLKNLLSDRFEVAVGGDPATGVGGWKTGLVRAAVVLAEPENLKGQPEPAEPAAVSGPLAKVSADLRALFADGGDKSSRVEATLREVPAANDPLVDLQNAGLVIEGRLGPLVFGKLSAANLATLAALPEVSSVRLPQAARQFGAAGVIFVPLERDAPAVQTAGAVRRLGRAKTIIVASDFRGWQSLLGKGLPADTKLYDFTAELTADLRPEPPLAGGEGELGEGVKLAQKFIGERGVDELILARIDSAAPFQVESIAEAVAGRSWSSPALAARMLELKRNQQRVEDEKKELRVLRRLTLDNFGIDDTAKASREKYWELQKAADAREKEVIAMSGRLLDFQEQARALRGAATILVGLSWADGYADLPGAHPTLRFLDQELLKGATWLQAAPVRGAGIWHGLFRDENGDGAMEFAAEGQPGQRRDLNFLAWKPKEGPVAAELPAGAVIQLKLQWQEAHDPRYAGAADDPYRQPLAQLRIVVLRQRDPSGKGLPADVFDVVGRSHGLPERIENEPRFSLYQTDFKFQVSQPGRYLVLVEGKEPQSLVPAGSAEVRAKKGEIRPKLIVEAIDPAHRTAGQPIFESFSVPH